MSTTVPAAPVVITRRQIRNWDGGAHSAPIQLADDNVWFALPAWTRAASVARRITRLWLESHGLGDDTQHAASVVVSELVTNAVQHTGSTWIRTCLRRSDHGVVIEVHDQGGTDSVPCPRRAGDSHDHGRGLALIAEYAQGWGFRLTTKRGCAVWAVVEDASGASPPPDRGGEPPSSDTDTRQRVDVRSPLRIVGPVTRVSPRQAFRGWGFVSSTMG